jgi:hypothetical protein|tara:strand:- start:677 stop:982 length:306 start_codon:yes stop_codon:yes gene_type:complete
MKNEKDVKKAVKKVLDEYKEAGMWYFMPPANGYGRSGIPDFIGCYKGNMFGVETKFGKNEPTANQVREIHGIIQAKAQCWIVREYTVSDWANEFRGWAALC